VVAVSARMIAQLAVADGYRGEPRLGPLPATSTLRADRAPARRRSSKRPAGRSSRPGSTPERSGLRRRSRETGPTWWRNLARERETARKRPAELLDGCSVRRPVVRSQPPPRRRRGVQNSREPDRSTTPPARGGNRTDGCESRAQRRRAGAAYAAAGRGRPPAHVRNIVQRHIQGAVVLGGWAIADGRDANRPRHHRAVASPARLRVDPAPDSARACPRGEGRPELGRPASRAVCAEIAARFGVAPGHSESTRSGMAATPGYSKVTTRGRPAGLELFGARQLRGPTCGPPVASACPWPARRRRRGVRR